MFDTFITQSIILVLCASIIPLCISSLVGLIVAVAQTATQIQEQSLSFLVKFITMCALAAFGGQWFMFTLVEMFREFLLSLPLLGRLP